VLPQTKIYHYTTGRNCCTTYYLW